MIALSIFVSIVVLIIQIVLAIRFADIAEEKGHERSGYLLLCVLFGAIGYIMVAALPDLTLHAKLDDLLHKDAPQKRPVFNTGKKTNVPTQAYDPQEDTDYHAAKAIVIGDEWVCGRCGTHNKKQYGQCKKCAAFRR